VLALKVRAKGVKLVKLAETARKAVPDVLTLKNGLAGLEEQNEKFRDNAAYTELEAEIWELQNDVDGATAGIAGIDNKKKKTMASAQFPVEGLGLEDAGVTFEGLPLQEVASSVQLRVSIAIGIALNPTLKILLIRNGNLLDDDSLKLVAQQAEKADAQVWVEYVTASAEGVSVMLEDGHIQEG